jgi:hypothetical protein
MAAQITTQALLETLNKINAYRKVMRTLTLLHQPFAGSDDHGIHLKCSSLALHCAQEGGLQGVM